MSRHLTPKQHETYSGNGYETLNGLQVPSPPAFEIGLPFQRTGGHRGPPLSVAEGANLRIPQNQLFVDGRADSFLASGNDQNSYNITADADVSIGQRASHGDRFFVGSIDEVRIYDRALSPAEIAGLTGRTALIHKPF